ncbi:MAG: hypothetical protein CMK72_07925 [Pseudomonadaceae bacterium]|nr:hypothetical protein [Pseudomonadaceae bacterium]HCP54913.1 hypothetical protein [Pseudomonas sp.]
MSALRRLICCAERTDAIERFACFNAGLPHEELVSVTSAVDLLLRGCTLTQPCPYRIARDVFIQPVRKRMGRTKETP